MPTTPKKKPTKTTAKHSTSSPDQYTKPELRERIKESVLAGDKGGKPGQWSARKAQLVASEYEREGGAYKHPRTDAQEHLHAWTEEHWHTSDNQPAVRGSVTTRYLPDEAWQKLTPEQKRATEAKKVRGSRQGKQFVANTAPAAEARRSAQKAAQPRRSRAAGAAAKSSAGKSARASGAPKKTAVGAGQKTSAKRRSAAKTSPAD